MGGQADGTLRRGGCAARRACSRCRTPPARRLVLDLRPAMEYPQPTGNTAMRSEALTDPLGNGTTALVDVPKPPPVFIRVPIEGKGERDLDISCHLAWLDEAASSCAAEAYFHAACCASFAASCLRMLAPERPRDGEVVASKAAALRTLAAARRHLLAGRLDAAADAAEDAVWALLDLRDAAAELPAR